MLVKVREFILFEKLAMSEAVSPVYGILMAKKFVWGKFASGEGGICCIWEFGTAYIFLRAVCRWLERRAGIWWKRWEAQKRRGWLHRPSSSGRLDSRKRSGNWISLLRRMRLFGSQIKSELFNSARITGVIIFPVAGPLLWISLLCNLQWSDPTLQQFRRALKTNLFGWLRLQHLVTSCL